MVNFNSDSFILRLSHYLLATIFSFILIGLIIVLVEMVHGYKDPTHETGFFTPNGATAVELQPSDVVGFADLELTKKGKQISNRILFKSDLIQNDGALLKIPVRLIFQFFPVSIVALQILIICRYILFLGISFTLFSVVDDLKKQKLKIETVGKRIKKVSFFLVLSFFVISFNFRLQGELTNGSIQLIKATP